MASSLSIRAAAASDREFVCGTLSEMMWPLLPADRKTNTDEATTKALVRNHVDFLLEGEGVAVLIAQGDAGERLGILLLGERRHLFTGEREGFVHYLFVASHARRAGVARQLLAEAERLARSRDYVFLNFEVLAQNDPMRTVAASLGYEDEYLGYRKSLTRVGAEESADSS